MAGSLMKDVQQLSSERSVCVNSSQLSARNAERKLLASHHAGTSKAAVVVSMLMNARNRQIIYVWTCKSVNSNTCSCCTFQTFT